MPAGDHTFEERGAAEEAAPGDQPRARGVEERAGAQHRETPCLRGRRVVVRRRTPLRQDVDEQPIGDGLAAPPAHPQLARDRGQIHERALAPDVAAGIAPQLAPQFVERLAMAQHVHFEPAFVRRRVQAVQVAAGPLHLCEDVGSEPAGNEAGHGGEARHPEPPAPEAGLPEPSAGLQRDHQHVPAPGSDRLQHRPGEHRRRADAGQWNPLPRHRREPRVEDLGAGDRAEQHPVVTPAPRLPPQPDRTDVARVRERPGGPGAKQRAPVPGEHVGDGLLAKVLHHVGDEAGDVGREPAEVAGEPRDPLLVRVERERVEQRRAAPVVHGQPVAGDDECPPRRHQMPSPVMRS